jgi:gamma-butyrobetaine hydroxylase
MFTPGPPPRLGSRADDRAVEIAGLTLIGDGARLAVDWDDGHRGVFHGLWLRDNCGCAACRHPSGQRLVAVHDLPPSPCATAARQRAGRVEARFEDGHESSWDAAWLRVHCCCGGHGASEHAQRLWDAGLQEALPEFGYDELSGWLAAVDELGFAILRDGPASPGTVLEVAERFGFVRETNYGRAFDVRATVSPANLAFTSLGLPAHTDNPYRDPTPSLQLLHCISSSAVGGDSYLVDGFRVAGDLLGDDFALLARHPIRFAYRDERVELEHSAAVLELDPAGDLRAVRFNTRSAQPIVLPPHVVEPYYAAYRTFACALEAPRSRVQFRLAPGDLFIVDNLRVLHGRTGYDGFEGERFLQGAYADRDGLRSTLAVRSRGR